MQNLQYFPLVKFSILNVDICCYIATSQSFYFILLHRIAIGTNQLYVFVNPPEAAKLKEQGVRIEEVSYEIAQEELAKNSGLNVRRDSKTDSGEQKWDICFHEEYYLCGFENVTDFNPSLYFYWFCLGAPTIILLGAKFRIAKVVR